jgi:hypothetical protein
MIKATSKMKDGRPLLLLELSGENITRMLSTEPIKVNVGQLGDDMPEMEIVIFGGRTEEDLANQLKAAGLIGPGTKQRFDG